MGKSSKKPKMEVAAPLTMESPMKTGKRSSEEDTKKQQSSKRQKGGVDELVFGQHEVKKPKMTTIGVPNKKIADSSSLDSFSDSDKVKSFSKPVFDVEESSTDSSDEEPQIRTVNVLHSKKDITCNSVSDDHSSEGSSEKEPSESNHIKQDADKGFNDALEECGTSKRTSMKSKDESKARLHRNKKSGIKTLFVGNLSFQATRDDVLKFFEGTAEVTDVQLATSNDSFLGFGHALFASEEDAEKALGLNGQMLLGRSVRLALSHEGSSLKPLEEYFFSPVSYKEDGHPRIGWKGPGRCVFVKGFAKSLKEEQIRRSLKEHFGCCGEIARVSIPQDHKTGSSKGFAYLLFNDIHSASKALELNGTDLGGHILKVGKPKDKVDSRDGSCAKVKRSSVKDLGRDGVGRGHGRRVKARRCS
ncbi:hypothetical protein HPP92_014004 [Vanilla planifolia]|uniref:RRM domain-containing protein n=1 Tax=Vanilla planifolia TaxID=51239 RepID=A0A835QSR1_VANPL|nr:hypothetical protein HPP92_014004 [Vanilla planifolia]